MDSGTGRLVSYLPRWLGICFGALVLLNHFVSSSPTPAQLRSEALGLCLAVFSATLPFLGRFLELIAIGNVLCARGYWDPPADTSTYAMTESSKNQMLRIGVADLRDSLSLLNFSDSRLGKILPDGVLSVLAQPVLSRPDPANGETKTEDLILLTSNANYAYSEKYRIWIRTIANKFQRS